jgi:hypothetical protein
MSHRTAYVNPEYVVKDDIIRFRDTSVRAGPFAVLDSAIAQARTLSLTEPDRTFTVFLRGDYGATTPRARARKGAAAWVRSCPPCGGAGGSTKVGYFGGVNVPCEKCSGTGTP